MKLFHTIAIPDSDILEGKLTMNVFAANIWETYVDRIIPNYDLAINLTPHENKVVRYVITQEEITKKGIQ